eukprot:806085-Heterocapsa_arctica.AAC.1
MKCWMRRSDDVSWQRKLHEDETFQFGGDITYHLYGRGVEFVKRRMVRRCTRPSSTCGSRRCVRGLRLTVLYVRGVRG